MTEQRQSPSPNEEAQQSGQSSGQLTLRMLIQSKDAGMIIGKGGSHVQQIREETRARIRVADAFGQSRERIVFVAGNVEEVANATGKISEKIMSESHYSQVQIRLLIPHQQMGALIGKSGSKIRDIQATTHTRISASDQLLPNSTDRLVTISSSDSAPIRDATFMIAQVLEGADLRGHVPYKGQPEQRPSGRHNREGDLQTQQINIPVSMVGAIIGRRGQKIQEIRNQSGAQIRISDSQDSEDRLVTISGSQASIQQALLMVYARLEYEKKRHEENNQE